VHKLRDLAHFTAIFAAYRLLPDEPARRLPGSSLPRAGRRRRLVVDTKPALGVASGIVLLIAYALALSLNLLRGRRDLNALRCGS